MEQKITIEEKYSSYWIQITLALILFTIIFLAAYSYTTNILWEGVLRLIAFCGLAATVFSALKVMQGKLTAELSAEDGNLVITYRKNKREVARDIFPLDDFRELYTRQHASFLGEKYLFNDLNIQFLAGDSDRALTLIEASGRPLALSEETARQTIDFVEAHAPNIDSNPQ